MVCNCESSATNTGATSCQLISNVTKKLLVVPLTDKDGNYNQIDLASDMVNGILPAQFIEDKINEPDPFKRWYATPGEFENYAGEVADPVTKEYDGGRVQKIREGAESFSALLVGYEKSFMDKLNDIGCTKFGVYVITKNGNLEGTLVGSLITGKLRPTAVYEGSWNVKPMPANETDTLAEALVTFTFSVLERLKDRKMLTASNIGINLLTISGLIDILGVVTPVDNTSYTLSTPTCFGDVSSPILVEGLDETEILTGGVASVGVTENANGTYTVTHAQAAGATVVTVSKTGFFMNPITFTNPA